MQIKAGQCSAAPGWSNLATLCGPVVPVVLISVWCSGGINTNLLGAVVVLWCLCGAMVLVVAVRYSSGTGVVVVQWWYWCLCGSVVVLVYVWCTSGTGVCVVV